MHHRQAQLKAVTVALGLILVVGLQQVTAAFAGASADDILSNQHLQTLARESLQNHVDSADLKAWRDTCAKEEAAAFDFLFAWLPPSDLASWRAPQILSDIRLALRTRREASWGKLLPDRLFYTYVLPHRVAQEPIQPWRPRLHDLLLDRVKDKNLREAALEVNRFCREWATFMPTSARDQGPLTTMERGRGRCEEETILYICAARSVGIPARPCYTPWWTASDNNHAWVEVWAGDGWHFLGACEPAADLDQAWFTGPAKRAGFVLALAYGEADAAAEDVYALDKGTTLFNVTPNYNLSGRLRITAAAAPSAGPVDSITVHLHVFNSGCLMELAQCVAQKSLSLGPGEYVASWETRSGPQAALVTIRPGRETVLDLDLAHPKTHRLDWMEQPFWLRIPVPPPEAAGSAGRSDPMDPLVQRSHELAVVQRDLLRADQAKMTDDRLSRIASRICSENGLAALLAQLSPAGIQVNKWATLLAATSVDTFAAVRSLLLEMDDKDFFECDTSSARTAVGRALQVRSWWKDKGVSIPDSLWASFVLSPRIEGQPGDLGLWVNLPFLLPAGVDSLGAAARECHVRFAQSLRRASASRLGHTAKPSETWLSTTATLSAARVALVGLLRRNGIPARVDTDRRWVEFWNGGRWLPLDPFGVRPSTDQSKAMARAYQEPAVFEARILERGTPAPDEEEVENLCLARFVRGRFEPLWRAYSIRSGILRLTIEPGDYWFFGGQRNHTGSPRVVARRFTARSGGKTRFDLDLGIPLAQWEPADLAGRDLSPEGSAFLRDLVRGRAAGGPAPILAFIWSPSSEPCQRTAESLKKLGGEGMERGLTLVSLQCDQGKAADRDLLSAVRGHGTLISRSIGPDELERLFGLSDATRLPLLLLLDEQDRTRLCLEGMQPSAPQLIRMALNLR